jgi:hypothetical protein
VAADAVGDPAAAAGLRLNTTKGGRYGKRNTHARPVAAAGADPVSRNCRIVAVYPDLARDGLTILIEDKEIPEREAGEERPIIYAKFTKRYTTEFVSWTILDK